MRILECLSCTLPLYWHPYSLSGRLYIENNGVQALKLYITKIMNSDAGVYTCEGTLDGTRETKNINLGLFSEYIVEYDFY